MNTWDMMHAHSKAANKTSAMAVSGGESYSPSLVNHEDFDVPPPYFQIHELPKHFKRNQQNIDACTNIYGLKNFRLTVLGLAKSAPKSSTRTSRFTCKCSCGMFCLRTAKQMKKGVNQACGVCQKNFDRTRREMGGSYKTTNEQVWQRMGGA